MAILRLYHGPQNWSAGRGNAEIDCGKSEFLFSMSALWGWPDLILGRAILPNVTQGGHAQWLV